MKTPADRRWFTTLRAFRLRTIGPPLAVAAVSVAALVWFDRVWIPTQQQYLNERNLRALRTISAQIKAKVDNFDLAIDHAIDSFPIEDGNNELLQKYVKLFSPELEIVTFDATRAAAAKVTPGEPPSVRVQRDEGRNYLYISYQHEVAHRKVHSPISLIARADIEQLAASNLTRSDFDALLLVDGQGATIAQQSGSGLELTSVDRLRDRGQSAEPDAEPDVFNRMRGTTNLAVITIGAADYMLYAQPVQLSLLHEGKETTQGPELWTLCGLVRLDRFRATSSTIPTTYWLFFGAVLAIICFAIPLVKLRVLSPRERLRRVDSVSVAAAVFLMMALAAFTAVDLRLFGSVVPAAVDDQLQTVAASMSAHVHLEVEAIDKQMQAFHRPDMWQDTLEYRLEDYPNVTEVRKHLEPGEGAAINLNSEAGRRSQCAPAWSCRSGVLSRLGPFDPTAAKKIDYPFFKMIVWSDDAGWQRIKWSTSSVVTPFINVDEAQLGYAGSLKLARRFRGDGNVPTSGVSVVMSPNTGEKLTAFWKALPALAVHREPRRPDLLGAILSATPMSLTNPVVPKNVQFAVLDRTGRVMFHSDAARSLTENFFQESEDSPALKSLVVSRARGAVSGRYQGRAHRFHVTPLDLAPFGDPRWSLVVFQDTAISETANLQTITLAVSLFGLYAIGLAAGWAILGALWPRALSKWLWPAPEKGPRYRRAAMVSTVPGVLCVGALVSLRPLALLSVAAILIVAALAAVFAVVRSGRDRTPSTTWLADFFRARASLLFLLAAVPAMVCFHIAYAFNAELVAKRAESHLASELGARARRINAQTQRIAVCSEGDSGSQTCAEVAALVARRTMNTLWDVHVPVTRDQRDTLASDAQFGPSALQAFLSYAYRPYNEIAADVLMTPAAQPRRGLERWRVAVHGDGTPVFTGDAASTGWKFAPAIARQSPGGVGFWLMTAVLLAAAYALVRYLLRPLFALDLTAPALFPAATAAADDTSLLVVGPARSRRSARLRMHSRVRVFDVRSLAFADQPIMVMPSTPARASSAADRGPTIDDQDVPWTESIHLATAHPFTIVAVDHLDHRLHDQDFRHRLLECLEAAVYGRGATIWCSSPRNPIELLEELDPAAPDRQRWARLFEGFRRENLGLEIDDRGVNGLKQSLEKARDPLAPALQSLIVSECGVAPELLAIGESIAARVPFGVPVSDETMLAEIGRAAESFYIALWSGCSTDDRVMLRQLAEEGLVNPNNRAAARMLGAGLVHRDPTLRVMNETFRRFVIGAASPQMISAWEHDGVRVPWGTIATTGVTVAFGLAGLLLLTQEQLVDAWISYVPAFAPAIPTVWRVLTGAQKGRIDAVA